MTEYQGNKFEEFIRKNHIGIQEAADKLKVSRNQVYKYFKSRNLEVDTVANILHVFDVREEEIFGQKKKPTRDFSVEEPDNTEAFGDERWIDRKLSFIENLEKIIRFKEDGYITEEEFIRIKNKIMPKD